MNHPLQRIMYAEDDLAIQAIARVSLEKVGGFTLAICDSGEHLLEELAAFKPDLIMLDVMMPIMDGPTALIRLQEHEEWREIPVLFITAKNQSAEIQHLLDLGAIAVLNKPFDPMMLADEIRQTWEAYYNEQA